MSLIWQMAYLQLLDLLTTILFLGGGVKEANPILIAMLRQPHALLKLIAVKAAIVSVAAVVLYWPRFARRAIFSGSRLRILQTAKAYRRGTWALQAAIVFYAALVVWNLLAYLARPL